MDTILSSDREFRPTKHHKKGFDEKRFTSEGSSSFHSSPVSLSSGIGASEDRDTGDTDSRASGETEPGESEPRPQHHHGHRHRWSVTSSNSWAYFRSLLPQFSNHRKLVYRYQYKKAFQTVEKDNKYNSILVNHPTFFWETYEPPAKFEILLLGFNNVFVSTNTELMGLS